MYVSNVREAFWRAVEAEHVEYIHVWNGVKGNGVRQVWDREVKRSQEIPANGKMYPSRKACCRA